MGKKNDSKKTEEKDPVELGDEPVIDPTELTPAELDAIAAADLTPEVPAPELTPPARPSNMPLPAVAAVHPDRARFIALRDAVSALLAATPALLTTLSGMTPELHAAYTDARALTQATLDHTAL